VAQEDRRIVRPAGAGQGTTRTHDLLHGVVGRSVNAVARSRPTPAGARGRRYTFVRATSSIQGVDTTREVVEVRVTSKPMECSSKRSWIATDGGTPAVQGPPSATRRLEGWMGSGLHIPTDGTTATRMLVAVLRVQSASPSLPCLYRPPARIVCRFAITGRPA